jgi:hypothetical protein
VREAIAEEDKDNITADVDEAEGDRPATSLRQADSSHLLLALKVSAAQVLGICLADVLKLQHNMTLHSLPQRDSYVNTRELSENDTCHSEGKDQIKSGLLNLNVKESLETSA